MLFCDTSVEMIYCPIRGLFLLDVGVQYNLHTVKSQ